MNGNNKHKLIWVKMSGYTTKSGRVIQPYMKRVNHVSEYIKPEKKIKKHSLFTGAQYKKYNDIIDFESPYAAQYAIKTLYEEFNETDTKDKHLRIARVTNYAANRANATLNRKQLSKEEMREFKLISAMYNRAAKKLWKKYRRIYK